MHAELRATDLPSGDALERQIAAGSADWNDTQRDSVWVKARSSAGDGGVTCERGSDEQLSWHHEPAETPCHPPTGIVAATLTPISSEHHLVQDINDESCLAHTEHPAFDAQNVWPYQRSARQSGI